MTKTERSAAAESDHQSDRVPLGFPPDAVIVVADADGHYPSDHRFSEPYMWIWIDGPAWFYVKEFPLPNPGPRN